MSRDDNDTPLTDVNFLETIREFQLTPGKDALHLLRSNLEALQKRVYSLEQAEEIENENETPYNMLPPSRSTRIQQQYRDVLEAIKIHKEGEQQERMLLAQRVTSLEQSLLKRSHSLVK